MKTLLNFIAGVLSVLLLAAFIMTPSQSNAGVLEFDYTIDFDIPAGDFSLWPQSVINLENFGVDESWDNWFDTGYFRAGVDLYDFHTQEHSISVPLRLSLEYPDEVSPGQDIVLNPSYSLVSAPSFNTTSDVRFDTGLYLQADLPALPVYDEYISTIDLFNTNTVGLPFVSLPDELTIDVGSNTFGGDFSLNMIDTSADAVLTQTRWSTDPFGTPLPDAASSGTEFVGLELSNTGQGNAWDHSADQMTIASYIYAPLAAVDPIVDHLVTLGIDIVESNTLTMDFLAGYYSFGGATYDHFWWNEAGALPTIRIPDAVAPGSTLNMSMDLGGGFAINFDEDWVLDLAMTYAFDFGLFDLGPYTVFDIDLTTWDMQEFTTFFQWREDGIGNRSISFDVVEASTGPTYVPGGTSFARSETYDNYLLGRSDNLGGAGSDSVEVPGEEFIPNQNTLEFPTQIPEPSTLLLLGTGLIILFGFSRRKIA